MRGLKRFALYLVLTAALGLAVFLVFNGFVRECIATAFTGGTGIDCFALAYDNNGGVLVLGGEPGDYRLVAGNASGERGKTEAVTPPVSRWRPERIFAPTAGGYLLGMYSTGDTPARLMVYYVSDGAYTLLCSRDCTGVAVSEQMSSARLSSVAEYDGTLYFAVYSDARCTVYSYMPGAQSVLAEAEYSMNTPFDRAVVLSDGSMLVYISGNGLRMYSPEGLPAIYDSAAVAAELYQAAGEGAYMLDGDGTLWLLSTRMGTRQAVVDAGAARGAGALAVGRAGRVLLLDGQGHIFCTDDGETRNISSLTGRPAWLSIVILAALVLGVLAVAYALWYALCEHQRQQISLVLRSCVIMAVVLGLAVAAMSEYVIVPQAARRAEKTARAQLSLMARIAADVGLNDAALADRARDMAAADGDYADSFLVLYSFDGARWGVTASGCGLDGAVSPALLGWSNGYFDAAYGAAQAGEGAETFAVATRCGQEYYTAFVSLGGGRVLAASASSAEMLRSAAGDAALAVYAVSAVALLVVLVLLILLLPVRAGVMRVIRGIVALGAGNRNVEVIQRSRDEIQGLARSFNDMVEGIKQSTGQVHNLNDSYVRFVPRDIISLLGVESVENVDRQTFASRHMATMNVGFYFDEKIYASRSRELFDNINEVVGQTAGIVPQNNGTICGYAYDGFTAVFDDENNSAVSAAVAIRQKIIALNRERERKGVSPVNLCIALDVADVMMGVVGDAAHLEVSAVSTGFNTTRKLLTLFYRFEANILCTEAIARRANGYGSRYIGKTRDGDDYIRVYEIYDGDNYSTRAGKAASAQAFAGGVYTLYSRDFPAAKRIFMDIVRQYPMDGAAKFYLYLADLFEKDEPDEISLDH